MNVTTHLNKTVVRIPGGEVQFGHLSGSVVVWLHGEKHVVRDGEVDSQSDGDIPWSIDWRGR